MLNSRENSRYEPIMLLQMQSKRGDYMRVRNRGRTILLR